MSTLHHIVQTQAIAEEEVKATIERLLGGESERISMARYDAMSTPAFENAMIISELVRIVDEQAKRISALEARLPAKVAAKK
jgi:hypothetical protein